MIFETKNEDAFSFKFLRMHTCTGHFVGKLGKIKTKKRYILEKYDSEIYLDVSYSQFNWSAKYLNKINSTNKNGK